MDQQPGQQQGAAAPQYSPDGRYWWDGHQWVPVQQPAGGPPGTTPPRRRRRWPWVVGIGTVVLVVLLGVCTAAVGLTSGSKKQQASTAGAQAVAKSTPTASTAPKATTAPARNGSCSPQPCANDNYGWIVTINDLKYDAPSGNQFESPEAGNVYVTITVTFTNKTSQEQHANPTEFVLQDGAGIKHTITIVDACPAWQPVNLTSGATLGPKCLAFEATAGKPAGLTLVWTPSGFGGGYNIKLS